MKLSVRFVLPGLLLVAATSTTFASGGYPGQGWGPGNSSGNGTGPMNELAKYLKNLGIYLGYDITANPQSTSTNPPAPYQKLLDPNIQAAPSTLINTNFNAVTAFLAGSFTTITTPAVGQIVSTALKNSALPSVINSYANFSYNPNASSGSSSNSSTYGTMGNETGISVNGLIDQGSGSGSGIGSQNFQSDPVSQGILNILSTPDYSYCMSNDETTWQNCQYTAESSQYSGVMNQYQVMANVLGSSKSGGSGGGLGAGSAPLPGQYDYFQPAKVQPYLSQLNVNSLITPLMYSTTLYSNMGQGLGLLAYNDVQQAENFIRYVTGAVTPMTLPDRNQYNNLVAAANGAPSIKQAQAKATIVSYLTSIRTYAAQMSVGMGNLYYILSKRIPVNLPSSQGSSSLSSQALSEFNMATWRLFNPANATEPGAPTAWINQINNASPATVQKEMAVLLAEINYQLYLNRQQEERLLLTNSLIILQNAKAAQPSPLLNAPNTGTAGTTGTATGAQ